MYENYEILANETQFAKVRPQKKFDEYNWRSYQGRDTMGCNAYSPVQANGNGTWP